MNWLVLIATFAIAVMIGSFLAARLERSRPEWSPRRRLWTAALALPAFIFLATIAGIGLAMVMTPAPGGEYHDLYRAVYAVIGAIFFAVSLVGGLVGAAASVRKTQS